MAEVWVSVLYKVNANGPCKRPICPCIPDITPIIGQSTFDIMIHSSSRTKDAVGSPAHLVVKIVSIMPFGHW